MKNLYLQIKLNLMRFKTVYLSSFLMIFLLSSVHAQDTGPGPGSVTVFSEGGENFTLYLNGEAKNATASSRVVANVTEAPVSFRIVFQNSTIPELKKNGFRQGKNCIYSIVKNKKSEYVLKVKDCSDDAQAGDQMSSASNSSSSSSDQSVTATTNITSTPAQLSASYANGVITINDGRTIAVKKVKANGMTYPRVMMSALTGAHATITYDGNDEKYSAEIPFQYEVKDFSNNNSYLTLTVDEGGLAKTWHVKLQNANGYDLKIE
jgi:hypothetical protein